MSQGVIMEADGLRSPDGSARVPPNIEGSSEKVPGVRRSPDPHLAPEESVTHPHAGEP